MNPIERLRANRTILGDVQRLNSKHTAYLGLYNSHPHLLLIKDLIKNTLKAGVPLLVVDNHSDDGSWGTVLDTLVQEFPNVVFVRNPINLGGFGSLSTNLDLLSGCEWVTTFHQDDTYSPNHLLVHSRVISSCDSNVGIVSSEQESFLPNGRKLGYPRASWLMENEPDPPTLFLANLVHHTIPFSGASFRLEVLAEAVIPWHSTAFPDTEIVLKMIPKWTGLVTDQVLVQYQENPNSESHSISTNEMEMGAKQALIRIFASDRFGEVCSLVDPDAADEFIEHLLTGVSRRISNPKYLSEVHLVALESMVQVFGPKAIISERLEKFYGSIGAYQAAELLHRLHEYEQAPSVNISTDLACFTREPAPSSKTGPQRKFKVHIKSILARCLGVLPRQLRVKLVKGFLNSLHWVGLKTKWFFPKL
jgi:glycosyltransferase involved in cell wall biosynthesis